MREVIRFVIRVSNAAVTETFRYDYFVVIQDINYVYVLSAFDEQLISTWRYLYLREVIISIV